MTTCFELRILHDPLCFLLIPISLGASLNPFIAIIAPADDFRDLEAAPHQTPDRDNVIFIPLLHTYTASIVV